MLAAPTAAIDHPVFPRPSFPASPMKNSSRAVYIGTDSGATTSKTGGVWDDGTPVSRKLRQSSTNAQLGTAAVVAGWVEGVAGFLADNQLAWDQVRGVGLALPGPTCVTACWAAAQTCPPGSRAGIFTPTTLRRSPRKPAGRCRSCAATTGIMAASAKPRARAVRRKASVLMLAPGSGLGAAYVDANGLPLDGDTLTGMEGGHMPAPLHLLGNIRAFACGCGRDWGCIEAYTTISGLPQLLAEFLPRHPNHELATSRAPIKEQVLSLRSRAQKGDALALEIFDFQARALGLHVANLTIALDAEFVVIGGGLIDPEATTPEFRARYLAGIRAAAEPYFSRCSASA
jgi:predicted NBD/HSP70 family sugar kinase